MLQESKALSDLIKRERGPKTYQCVIIVRGNCLFDQILGNNHRIRVRAPEASQIRIRENRRGSWLLGTSEVSLVRGRGKRRLRHCSHHRRRLRWRLERGEGEERKLREAFFQDLQLL